MSEKFPNQNSNKVPRYKSESIIENPEVSKTVELIKYNPNLVFLLSGNGNVLGNRGKDRGQEDYYFDKKQQKLIALNETTAKMYQSLDRPESDIPGKKSGERLELFKPYWNTFSAVSYNSSNEKITRPLTVASVRLPFIPSNKNNPFTDESGRPGVHLSFGLIYPNNKPEIFDSFNNKKIEEYLKNPNTDEAKKYLGNVFSKCAEQWIPEYWKFYQNEALKRNG